MWKGHIPGATEIVPLFAYCIKNLLLSKDFFEKNILIENTAHNPEKTHIEISKENTSLEPMIERLAIKDNRCSINYQSDLPYILKNWFNATN